MEIVPLVEEIEQMAEESCLEMVEKMPVEVGTEQVEGKSKLVLTEVLNLLVVGTGLVGVLMVEMKEAVVEMMLAKVKA